MQKVGQGDLIIRFTNDISIQNTLNYISIGDIFLLAGQSNAHGDADNLQKVESTNEFLTTVFYGLSTKNKHYETSEIKAGGDYVKRYEWHNGPYEEHSPWPIVSNLITESENIPLSFIQTSKGGGEIGWWEKGLGYNYEEITHSVSKATNGTMSVKAILFFQGESNAMGEYYEWPLDRYNNYKIHLKNLIHNLLEDIDVKKFVLGQTGEIIHAPDVMDGLSGVRKIQQELWNNENIIQGPITYDIGPLIDNLHFTTDKEIHEIANRWGISILKGVYGYEIPLNPELLDANLDNSKKKIILIFDKNIKLENWLKEEGQELKGLEIEDGENHLNYTNYRVEISNNEIYIILDQTISNYASISYANDGSSTGEYNIRETSSNSLPAKPFFQVILYYDQLKTQDWTLPKPNQQIKDGIPKIVRLFTLERNAISPAKITLTSDPKIDILNGI